MAQTPDIVAPDVAAQGVPDDYTRVQTNPDQFGALGSRALEKLGGAGVQAADTGLDIATQLKMQSNAVDALNRTTAISQKIGQTEAQFRTLQGADAYKNAPAYTKQISDSIDAEAANIGPPAERLKFLQDAHSFADRAIVNMSIHAGEQQKVALTNSLQSAIKEEQANVVRYTGTGQEPDFTGIVNKSLMLAHSQGLDQDSANALIQQNTGVAMRDAVITRIAAGDTAGAARMFQQGLAAKAPGTDLPLLDANHQATLSQMIQSKQMLDANRALTEQMRSMAYSDKIQRDAAEKSGNTIVSQMLKDPTQVDPQMIANDPNLKFEQKWSLNQMLQASLKKEGGHDAATYGDGFWPAYKQMQPDANGQIAITNPDQIWQLGASGALTVEGVSRLSSLMKANDKPEGVAENKMRDGAIEYAKRNLSFEADYGTFKLRDPKGEDAFNTGFLPAFFHAYDAGVAAGKTPYQLLSKDSPDFIVDKVMAPFKRSQSAYVSDRIAADADAGVDENLTPDGERIAAPVAPGGKAPTLGTIPPPVNVRVPGKTDVTTAKGHFMWQADGWHLIQ